MGAYAVYSDKPFKASGKLHMKRKRGMLDKNMEMLKMADDVIFDMENEKVLLLKDGKVLNDEFDKKTSFSHS